MKKRTSSVMSWVIPLLLLLLPVQTGYHFWPDWAIVSGRRIDYLSPTLYLSFVPVAVGCIYGVGRLMRWLTASKGHRFYPSAFILVAFLIVNMLTSQSPVASIILAGTWALLVVGIVVSGVPLPAPPLLARLIAFGLTWTGLLGIAQSISSSSIGGIMMLVGERTFATDTPGIALGELCAGGGSCREFLRAYATFPHPNVFAGYIATGLLVLASVYRKTPIRKLPVWLWPVVGVSGVALYFTQSLSGILGFAIGALVLFVPSHRLATLAAVGAITCAIIMSAGPLGRLFPYSQSILERSQLLLLSYDIFARAPLVGTGLGSFIPQAATLVPAPGSYLFQPVHSVYALALTETGVAGVALLIVSVALFFGHVRTSSPSRTGIAILAAFGVIGAFDHYPLTLHQGRLLVCIGLLFFLSRDFAMVQSRHEGRHTQAS